MSPQRIHSVFHPTDFSEGDQHAFHHALKIALCAQAELSLLHVERTEDESDWSDFPGVRATLTAWGVLAPGAGRQEVLQAGVRARKIQRTSDDPAAAIQEYVADAEPDLVVLSTHQRSGLARWMHRALAEPIARATPALTLFVPRRVLGFVRPDSGRVTLQKVLVAVDHVPNPQRALDAAATLARTLGATDTHFLIFHAGPGENLPRVTPPAEASWTHETEAWDGPVVDHLLATAEANDADLIVMAKRGHRGFLDALRGTTTERVVRGAQCPVLVAPVPSTI
ncbi:MAG: universal stress protein [Verrucomicrobiota bacterium]